MLVSTYFEKKQVCQAPAGRFTKEQVESLMIGIAKEFAAGLLQKNGLFSAREARAKAMGVNMCSRGSNTTVMKRHSTSAAVSAPPKEESHEKAEASDAETIVSASSEEVPDTHVG